MIYEQNKIQGSCIWICVTKRSKKVLVKRYYRGLRLTSGFHRVIIASLGLKRNSVIILRDGIATEFGDLYWGLINVKFLKGTLSFEERKLFLILPHLSLKFYLTGLNDLFIVGEVLVDEVYRPLVNDTLQNKVVVDVGSFIGVSPVYFALRSANVLAFEVLPFHYHFALLNLRLNNLTDKVILHNAAVGGLARRIWVPTNYGNYKFSIYHSTSKLPSKRTRFKHVDVFTLEDILAIIENKYDRDEIRLLKMDCEGCEYEFFKMCRVDDLKRIEEIVLEFHKSPSFIIEKLRKSGFNVVKLKATLRACNKR